MTSNTPNGHKTKKHYPFQGPPKPPICDFWYLKNASGVLVFQIALAYFPPLSVFAIVMTKEKFKPKEQ
jgi:hypothetical protein